MSGQHWVAGLKVQYVHGVEQIQARPLIFLLLIWWFDQIS